MNILLCIVLVAVVGVAAHHRNRNFATCCSNNKIQDSCLPYCSYKKKADEVLQAFEDGKCNFDTEGPAYYQCLEKLRDNRECCKSAGVGANPLLAFCLDKCDGTKPILPDHKYFGCKDYSQAIRDCGEKSHHIK